MIENCMTPPGANTRVAFALKVRVPITGFEAAVVAKVPRPPTMVDPPEIVKSWAVPGAKVP
jgi:hypothetical protein